MSFDLLARTDDQFGGRGRRGSAQIGNEINDREVGFVANGGDDGNIHLGDCASKTFMVERGQIFGASTAASNDDDVHAVGFAAELVCA